MPRLFNAQFYAIGLDCDQDGGGLNARLHGTLDQMSGYIGKSVGTQNYFYADSVYAIVIQRNTLMFKDGSGVLKPGKIYSVKQR